jgi:protocatechuate 3,4-dioxygenase beta subunit
MAARTALTTLLIAIVGVRLLIAQTRPSSDEPRFTDPPGAETPAIAALIDEASMLLGDGRIEVSSLLCDRRFMAAHEWPRFRQLVRQHAPRGSIRICGADEPGDRMRVRCTVRDGAGQAVRDAFVYLYHTSAKGWYSDRAPHYSGNSGDVKHARLFGYVKTDDAGVFELETIRPAGYPRSDLPQHIHISIDPPAESNLAALTSEILFEDDPRLAAPGARERATREGFRVCPVQREPDDAVRVVTDFQLAARGN